MTTIDIAQMHNPTNTYSELFRTWKDINHHSLDGEVLLHYFGEISQHLIKAYASGLEARLTNEGENSRTIKRLYNVMVESLQNIRKHSYIGIEQNEDTLTTGGILITRNGEKYLVTTCNAADASKITATMDWLWQINSLDEDGVKTLYKQRMRDSKLSAKGGAGLGFIDMVKKTGHPIKFHSDPLNDQLVCFLLTMSISRN